MGTRWAMACFGALLLAGCTSGVIDYACPPFQWMARTVEPGAYEALEERGNATGYNVSRDVPQEPRLPGHEGDQASVSAWKDLGRHQVLLTAFERDQRVDFEVMVDRYESGDVDRPPLETMRLWRIQTFQELGLPPPQERDVEFDEMSGVC